MGLRVEHHVARLGGVSIIIVWLMYCIVQDQLLPPLPADALSSLLFRCLLCSCAPVLLTVLSSTVRLVGALSRSVQWKRLAGDKEQVSEEFRLCLRHSVGPILPWLIKSSGLACFGPSSSTPPMSMSCIVVYCTVQYQEDSHEHVLSQEDSHGANAHHHRFDSVPTRRYSQCMLSRLAAG